MTVQIDKEETARELSHKWMGANLQYKGIKEVLDELSVAIKGTSEPTEKEVKNDWRRLASFMAGRN